MSHLSAVIHRPRNNFHQKASENKEVEEEVEEKEEEEKKELEEEKEEAMEKGWRLKEGASGGIKRRRKRKKG